MNVYLLILSLSSVFAIIELVIIVSLVSLLCYFLIKKKKEKNNYKEEVIDLVKDNNDDINIEVVSKIAHDIKNSLNVIIGTNYRISNNLSNEDFILECLEKSNQSANMIINSLNNMLQMVSIDKKEITITLDRFDFGGLLGEVISISEAQAKIKKVSFTYEYDDKLKYTEYIGDKLHLYQVLLNLISNAIMLSSENDNISLSVCFKTIDSYHDEITFGITFSGNGVSADYLDKTFNNNDTDYITDKDNSLDLIIAKSLTSMMNGKIFAKNFSGKGTLITVTIPLIEANKYNLKKYEKKLNKKETIAFETLLKVMKGRNVLLAEDNIFNQEIMTNILNEHYGFKTEVAKNGKEAFDMFEKSTEGYYAFILMDIKMPFMDGLTSSKLIRNSPHVNAKSIPIIAISGNNILEEEAISVESGIDAFISKPVNIDELSMIMFRLLK